MNRILPHRNHLDRVRKSIDRARDLARLRDREASLMTITSEAPRQLATVRARIAEIEGNR